jgi:hypothetical protein
LDLGKGREISLSGDMIVPPRGPLSHPESSQLCDPFIGELGFVEDEVVCLTEESNAELPFSSISLNKDLFDWHSNYKSTPSSHVFNTFQVLSCRG